MSDVWQPFNGVYTATAPIFPWAASLSLPSMGPVFEWIGALISAAFGAGVGAWMAGRIARNTKLRDELLAELRSIDVAVTLCISTIDVAGSMKKQLISKIVEEHRSNREAFDKYLNGNREKPFTLNINHRRFPPIAPPIAELRNLVMKEMSISANGVKSMLALADAVENLNTIIYTYNKLVDRLQNNDMPPGLQPPQFYLGLPGVGIISREYPSTLEGLELYNNDILFFTKKLYECLHSRAVKARKLYEKKSGEWRQIRYIDFSANLELFPSDSNYANWMKGWEDDTDAITVKRRWWHR